MENQSIIIISFVFLLLSGAFILFILIFNKRTIAYKNELDVIQKNKSRELLQATIHSQEEERIRIGSNIHDDIGPLLSLLKIQISNYIRGNNGVRDQDELNDITNLIERCIEQVRLISSDLFPSVLYELGLETALDELVNRLTSLSDAKVIYIKTNDLSSLSKRKAIAVFRIIQESCMNILKHARAKNIEIHILKENEQVKIIIQDDGIGFNPEILTKTLGIKNMIARAEAIKGEINIKSDKNLGSIVQLTFPYHD